MAYSFFVKSGDKERWRINHLHNDSRLQRTLYSLYRFIREEEIWERWTKLESMFSVKRVFKSNLVAESSFSFWPKSLVLSTENSSTRWEDLSDQWIESRMQSLNELAPLKLLCPCYGRTRRGRQSQISYCFYLWSCFEVPQVCPFKEKEINNIDLVVMGNDTESKKCYVKPMKSQLNLEVCKQISTATLAP